MVEYYKIEKGIPTPERCRGLQSTLDEMEIGDSCLIPFSLRTSWGHVSKRTGKFFTYKTLVKGEYGRIWRIK